MEARASQELDAAVKFGQPDKPKVRKLAKQAIVIVALAVTPGALIVFLLYRWLGHRSRHAPDVAPIFVKPPEK